MENSHVFYNVQEIFREHCLFFELDIFDNPVDISPFNFHIIFQYIQFCFVMMRNMDLVALFSCDYMSLDYPFLLDELLNTYY